MKIEGHRELRVALRDTEKFSSDLQGDSDVRDYRQIPLEIDPPRHHLFRTALSPFFVKSTIEKLVPEFRANTARFIEHYINEEDLDVVAELALPIVMHNLGVIYRRPQDVDEWISWGPDVWTASGEVRDGKVLHDYLDRIYEEAMVGKRDDVWREITRLKIEGKVVSPIEFRGIAGVLLAGGRDTVVKLLSGIIWHFAHKPESLAFLNKNPDRIPSAIHEFLRFLSPLPAMNRTTVPETGAKELPSDRYVEMRFISANFDETVFQSPFEIRFDRERNPHMSFGFGPHTCLGNHVAEIEARVFIEELLRFGGKWIVDLENVFFHEKPLHMVPERFELLRLKRVPEL